MTRACIVASFLNNEPRARAFIHDCRVSQPGKVFRLTECIVNPYLTYYDIREELEDGTMPDAPTLAGGY